ncbi:DUF2484 family protein [Cognatishimia sp. F0-27]|uniref:DUF2484 family protein n=1 Tax=Cognatishimia sp. F0-27 TaxID=2816855 RepID=UPI001D0C64C4|nr:DUF2484 family protein [Cognatishimia sp. F0-27]MCC1492521.1 DUF2484 family protein [Cognatishimia sp. F0-27]
MALSVIAGFLWLLIANVLAMIPSKDNHWSRAYVLIAVGVPIFLWIGIESGWLIACFFLAAGMSVLRWPVRYLFAWIKRMLSRG